MAHRTRKQIRLRSAKLRIKILACFRLQCIPRCMTMVHVTAILIAEIGDLRKLVKNCFKLNSKQALIQFLYIMLLLIMKPYNETVL